MFDELKNRKITGLYVSENESTLKFETDTLPIYYTTEGDCCSESWWADIIGVDNLINHIVTDIKELEVSIPDNDTRTRQEYDRAYGYQLKTTKGICDFIFRNSSNGYYGGWAYHLDLTKQNPNDSYTNYLTKNMRPITEDWSA